MKRILAPLVGLLFAAMLLAPSVVLFQFKLDQQRIAKELCVQRDLMEGMRSCHGECQLSKRFKALEQEAEAGFPAESMQVRYEPVMDLGAPPVLILPLVTDLFSGQPLFALSEGFGKQAEHIPRG